MFVETTCNLILAVAGHPAANCRQTARYTGSIRSSLRETAADDDDADDDDGDDDTNLET